MSVPKGVPSISIPSSLHVLKVWVILQKKISPLEYVSGCGALSQEHCFSQVKVKIVIEFENWLH